MAELEKAVEAKPKRLYVCPACGRDHPQPGRHFGGKESWARPEWCYDEGQGDEYFVDRSIVHEFVAVTFVPQTPDKVMVELEEARERMATAFRDWVHESPMTQCGGGADTCPDWPLAYELADVARSALTSEEGNDER